jgi:hypothetical protein
MEATPKLRLSQAPPQKGKSSWHALASIPLLVRFDHFRNGTFVQDGGFFSTRPRPAVAPPGAFYKR